MAYIFKDTQREKLPFLPAKVKIDSFSDGLIDYFNPETDFETCHWLLNYEIETGKSYPFTDQFSEQEFKQYFLSGDTFVLKNGQQGSILGTFYVKPNFPGPCSHICNGGFIVHPSHRRKKIGLTLGTLFPYIASSLGYEASMFNLVFKDNPASVELWRRLGFQELGTIPRAKKAKDGQYHDAIQFYLDFAQHGEKPSIMH